MAAESVKITIKGREALLFLFLVGFIKHKMCFPRFYFVCISRHWSQCRQYFPASLCTLPTMLHTNARRTNMITTSKRRRVAFPEVSALKKHLSWVWWKWKILIVPRVGNEHAFLAFWASVLPIHHIGSLMSPINPCLPVYAASCLRVLCRLLHSSSESLNSLYAYNYIHTGNDLSYTYTE